MTRVLSHLFALDRFAWRELRRSGIEADVAQLSDRLLRDIGYEPASIRGQRPEAFLVRLPI